ncbi:MULTISPECIES: sensor histidine kinase [Bacillus]|uniref:sensor histidine kinase n=1 Tax=Bacillus TaxID=1386 RepID=UPI002243CB77|nr:MULTISPECIES: HAMP domain-containing sensor histidine kinase [Bacillus]MDN5388523.1 HAMP domain-containing sensor histidine kinase [Bacillus sp. LB7]MEC1084799.1 HAMP domain-containing sensor histidine kinase [Bacillus paralicheniformis]MEC1102349.1 HAMP domain-containing sensor histidine kinase [Bacillus paralicheniformis]MEC1109871.1 HAMP domain-containing sensor histidine kinase [Bacillus paralicheniformis]MEC1137072.1 HAMP domain-containing sensor histidine kinase [Bacillus paralichenif
MKLRGKLVLHFVSQIFLILGLVLATLLLSFIFFALRLSESEADTGLAKATSDTFESWVSVDDNNNWQIEDILKSAIDKQGGWLQILDGKEKTVYSYRLPPEIQRQYHKEDLVSVFDKKRIKKYQVNFWSANFNDEDYVILFGWESKSDTILSYLEKEEKNMADLSSYKKSTLDFIKKNKGSVYLFSEKGKMLDSVYQDIDYSQGITELELLKYGSKPWNYEHEFSYRRLSATEWLIAATPNPIYNPDHEFNRTMIGLALKIVLLVIGVLIVLMSSMTIWYSFRFGMPIIHTIKWIVNLSKGRFEEPRNRKGRPQSRNKKGKRKQPYRLFTEVFESMEQLTETLKKDEQNRKKIQTTREEWIAGLSHDLKTPLSTIYGYSMMLESPNYEWSKEEIREIGQAMKEKSDYMSQLIEDLNLTYRLKNDALPIKRQTVRLVPFLKSFVEEFKRHSFSEGYNVSFEYTQEDTEFAIDRGWFRRVLENLLANAVKHNKKGTDIKVILEETKQYIILKIQDNGRGMDSETVSNLFNRYYRGTHTKDATEGSGLGLAISLELVHLHDGCIAVDSRTGSGTEITMEFKKNPKATK